MLKKKLLFFLTSIILSTFIAVNITELFFMLYPAYRIIKHWDYFEEVAGTTIFHGLKLQGNLNSMGLRDKEYPFDHESYRIIIMGDSFTYGLGLKNSNSWPKKTEQYLHDKGYNNIEILNGGIPDTNTRQQVAFFNKYTCDYKPDMVIIGFIINDCGELCSNCGAVKLKHQLDAIANSAKQRFGLYAFNYIRFAYLKYKLTNATVKEYSMPYEKETEPFQQCKRAFLDFKELSQKNNFELIVVIYPMLVQLNKNYPFNSIHRKMEAFFKEAGIEAYDLTQEFYGYRDTDLWINYVDSHPNKKANEIVAKKIVEIITKHFIKSERRGYYSQKISLSLN